MQKQTKMKQDNAALPENTFTRTLNDYGYSFCSFAGAPMLNITEDYEVAGEDIHPASGDWVVHDTRGQSGTYGLSHEDLSIYKIKIKKPAKHGVDYCQQSIDVIVSTDDLMQRFKWVGYLFDKSSSDVTYANPMNHWVKQKLMDEDYEKEKQYFHNDPHLALYWLFHFGFLMDRRFEEVKTLARNQDHVYIQGCIEFFDYLEQHPDFDIEPYYSWDRNADPMKYRDLFKRRRAYAIFKQYSYGYILKEKDVQNWWNSISVYPQVEKYLIRRVRWLKNNLVKLDAWAEFNQIIQNEPMDTLSLMSYVQVFNPEVCDKNQQAHRFLEELKTNSVVWSSATDKLFASIMIHDVREFIDSKEFLGELVDLYFHDTLTEQYAEMMRFLGRGSVSEADQKIAKNLVESMQETPEDIKLHFSGRSEQIIKLVLNNLMDQRLYILQHIPYYLLSHPIKEAEHFLKILFYEKEAGSSDIKKVEQCMSGNTAAIEIILRLLAHTQEKEDREFTKAKSHIANFLGPYVHQPEVFEYITGVLQAKQADNTYLLHQIIIANLLFTYRSNYAQNSSSQLDESQCTTVLNILESLYKERINRSLDSKTMNRTIEKCISCCRNKHALPWLSRAKYLHTGKFLVEICSALLNMGSQGAVELVELLFSDRPVAIFTKQLGKAIDLELHKTVLDKIQEKSDLLAGAKYFHVLMDLGNDVYMFDMAFVMFKFLQSKSDKERKKHLSHEPSLASRIKFLLFQGVASGITAGKKSHIQDMFDMADSLTNRKPMTYFLDTTITVEYIFDDMKKILTRLKKGDFAKKTVKKQSVQGNIKEKILFDKIKDRTVAKENEFKFRARIWQNPETSEILYIDKSNQLHFFDGRTVCQPPFKIVNLLKKDDFISKGDQRKDTIMYVKPKKGVAEFIRFNETKIACYLCAFEPHYYSGFGSSHWFYLNLAWGFKFETKHKADVFFKTAKEAFPLDFPATTSWFADKAGTITRRYERSKSSIYLNLCEKGGRHLSYPGPFHEDPTESQVSEYSKKEMDLFARGYYLDGYTFNHIFYKRDTTLIDYLLKVVSTKNKNYWRRPTDFYDYLTEWYRSFQLTCQAGLIDTDLLNIRFETQKPQKEIDKAIKEKIKPFSKTITNLWGACGALTLEIDDNFTIKIFSQQEVVENYDSDCQQMDQFFEKNFSDIDGKEERAFFKGAVPVARYENEGKKLLYVYVPKKRHYRCIPLHTRDPWYEYKDKLSVVDLLKSLFLYFFSKVEKDIKVLSVIKMGDQPGKNKKQTYLHLEDSKNNKFYILTMDIDNLSLFSRFGKAGTQGKLTRKIFQTKEELDHAYQKQLNKQTKKGYTEG